MAAVLALGLVCFVAGCGSGSNSTSSSTEGHLSISQGPTVPPVASKAKKKKRRKHAQRRPGCPSETKVLNGVYHPERLSVLNPCKTVRGRVALIREHEDDGDLHFDIAVRDKSLLRSGNYGQQEGLLVVEFMPRDFGHLPAPSVGDRVTLLGAWVDDTQHSWNEIHPSGRCRSTAGRSIEAARSSAAIPPTLAPTTRSRSAERAQVRRVPATAGAVPALVVRSRARSQTVAQQAAVGSAPADTAPACLLWET